MTQFGLPAVTDADPRIAAVAHVIQLSIAPIFVLTAVGTLLNVLAGRLSRIVDRTRRLEEKLGGLGTAEHPVVRGTISTLGRRAHVVSVAITYCVTCALCVCVAIVTLFGGAVLDRNVSGAVVLLFVAALLALTAGLGYFLAEVLMATRELKREIAARP
jgi:hypothetical protein